MSLIETAIRVHMAIPYKEDIDYGAALSLSVIYGKYAASLWAAGDKRRSFEITIAKVGGLVAFYEAQAAREPGNPAWRKGLAESLLELYSTQFVRGDRPAALATVRRALAISVDLVRANPRDVDLRIAEARAYEQLASAFTRNNADGLTQALAATNRALLIREGLVEEMPDNPDRLRDLQRSYMRRSTLGRERFRTDRPTEPVSGFVFDIERSLILLQASDDFLYGLSLANRVDLLGANQTARSLLAVIPKSSLKVSDSTNAQWNVVSREASLDEFILTANRIAGFEAIQDTPANKAGLRYAYHQVYFELAQLAADYTSFIDRSTAGGRSEAFRVLRRGLDSLLLLQESNLLHPVEVRLKARFEQALATLSPPEAWKDADQNMRVFLDRWDYLGLARALMAKGRAGELIRILDLEAKAAETISWLRPELRKLGADEGLLAQIVKAASELPAREQVVPGSEFKRLLDDLTGAPGHARLIPPTP